MPDNRVLIVGLGNPGSRYEKTLHNAGFLALDYLAAQEGLIINMEKMQGHYCSYRLAGKQVFLLKPQNFMNRSGECVARFSKYFDIDRRNILVVHDDLDLEPGRVKAVSGGGAGGHNGVRSLINHLGSTDFSRLKIGIGHPRDDSETSSIPVERFVLLRFSDTLWHDFQVNLPLIAEGIQLFIRQGIAAAMNKVNRKPILPD